MEDRIGVGGRIFAPDQAAQPGDRHGLAGLQEQQTQHEALAGPPEIDPISPRTGNHRAQQQEVHVAHI